MGFLENTPTFCTFSWARFTAGVYNSTAQIQAFDFSCRFCSLDSAVLPPLPTPQLQAHWHESAITRHQQQELAAPALHV